MKKQSIIYNTQTQQVSEIYPDLYINLYPKGKLKEHEHNLIVVNLPTPEHDTTTHRAVALPYFVDLENKTYTRGWEIVPLSELDLAQRDWHYPNRAKRIKADKKLGEDYPQLYVNFMLRNLEIVDVPENPEMVYIYCSEILKDHVPIIQALSDQIQVQNRPEILNNEVAQ